MSKFTKGKWQLNDNQDSVYVFDEEEGERLDIAPIIRSFREGEYRANARLIAAAPDMYRLLAMMCELDDQKLCAVEGKDHTAFMTAFVAQRDVVEAAKALLVCIDGNETEGGD